ncbi:MAG TPA: HAD hydrolase-like protein [Fibrobacteria bacterium]|nr:HAD hydrolase-like protein [Fibrobacteria bacterium]
MKAVVFDFDGTLADTLPRTMRLFPVLAKEFKFPDATPDQFQALRSLSAAEILRRLGISWWKAPLVLWRARSLLVRDTEPIEAFPGVVDLLCELDARGVEWGILTTNGWPLVRATLRSWGAPEPGWLEAGVGLSGKTRRLRRLAARFEIPTAEMIMVGDEVRDVEAACKAGAGMVAVGWGYNTVEALEKAQAPTVCTSVAMLRDRLLGAQPVE